MITIFVDGTNDHYIRGYNFPIGTAPKKIPFPSEGSFFGAHPIFLAVFGHSYIRGVPTLNFGLISTKLGGTYILLVDVSTNCEVFIGHWLPLSVTN